MSTTVSFNGANFTIPAVGERNFGQNLTNYFVAIATGAISKAGGNASLTADLNLGVNFGLVAKYLKSSSTNIAQSGVVRLANNEGVAWRNVANSADLVLKVNASDVLEYNGSPLAASSDLTALTTRVTTAEGTIITHTGQIATNTADILTKAPISTTVTLNGTQTITNKTVNGQVIGNYEDFTAVSAPAAPAAGKVRVFSDIADGKLYQKDSTGLTKPLGGSAGAGEKNYVVDGVNDATGWVASGAGITVTTESTVANLPDNSTQTTGIKFTRVSGTDYAYKRFTLDKADYNKKLKVQLDQAYAGAAGDYTVRVFSNTASNYAGTSAELSVSPSTSIPAATGQLQVTFDSTGSAAPYIEVRIYGNTGTTPLYVNNFLVGPGVIGQMPAVGFLGVQTSVTTTGFGTLGTTSVEYDRDGRRIKAIGFFVAGTTTATNATLSFPFGLSNVLTGGKIVGHWWRDTANASSRKKGDLYSTSGSSNMLFANDDYSSAASPVVALLGNVICNAGDTIFFEYEIPLYSDGTLNSGAGAQVAYASNSDSSTTASNTTTGFVSGGSLFPTRAPATGVADTIRRVVFPQPITTGRVQLEISFNSGLSWVPIGNSSGIDSYNVQGTTGYGMGWDAVSGNPNAIDVLFGGGGRASTGTAYQNVGATFSGVGQWRAVLANPSSPVGFGIATATDSGLVKSYSEGVFTPTLVTNGGTQTQTTGTRNGTYTKVGRSITFSLEVTPGSIAALSAGSISINGLPFAAAGAINATCSLYIAGGFTLPANTLPAAVIGTGSSAVTLVSQSTTGGGATALTLASFSSAVSLMVTGTYQAAT